MENLTNILVTGGGAPGSPGILKALRADKSLKLFSCDIHEISAGKFLADEYFTVLTGDAENYIEDLLTKCVNRKIKIIFPITTKELTPLSKSRSLFMQNGIEIIVSDFNELSIANDKGKLYNHLKNNNIAVPNFSIANSVAQFKSAASLLGYPKNTFIFKPCVANGSRGFRIVNDTKTGHDLLFNEKPNSTYISFNKATEILAEKAFPPLVVSEYLPGQEYTVDCLVNNGKVQLIIPRTREKMNNGISVAGTIEQNNEVIEYCSKILTQLKLDGPIGIQVKYSEKNVPLLVEINPRIQGTSVACIGANINIPLLAVRQKIDSKITLPSIKWGTHFMRYYKELYY